MSLKAIRSAGTLSELAAACRRAASTLDKDVNKIKQEAGRELAFRLIYETPVDTSLALSNWQASLVFPTTRKLPAYKEGNFGSTKEYSAARAYAAAAKMIKSAKPRIDVVMTHNLPYIHKLNLGGSPQQSAFFIERIVAQVDNKAQAQLKDYVNGY